jgi:hypothetical protein
LFSVHQLNCHFFLTHPFSYFCIISFQKGEGSSNKKKITCTNHVDRLLITSNLTQISQKFFFQVHGEFNTFVNRILTVAYLKNLNIMDIVHIRRSNWKDCRMSNEIRISNFHSSYLRCCIAKNFYETKHVIYFRTYLFLQILSLFVTAKIEQKNNNIDIQSLAAISKITEIVYYSSSPATLQFCKLYFQYYLVNPVNT